MLKRIVLLLCLSLVLPSVASAYDPGDFIESTSVGNATYTPTAVPGYFYGCLIETDGTNSVTLGVLDSTTSKTIIPTSYVATTSASNRSHSISFEIPVSYSSLYITSASSGVYTITAYFTKR